MRAKRHALAQRHVQIPEAGLPQDIALPRRSRTVPAVGIRNAALLNHTALVPLKSVRPVFGSPTML